MLDYHTSSVVPDLTAISTCRVNCMYREVQGVIYLASLDRPPVTRKNVCLLNNLNASSLTRSERHQSSFVSQIKKLKM